MTREQKEKQLVRALKRLEKMWDNKTHWIFSANGSLWLMRKDENGKRVVASNGGMDSRYCVQSFNKIENDGGDW